MKPNRDRDQRRSGRAVNTAATKVFRGPQKLRPVNEESRAVQAARYARSHNTTIRTAARVFGIHSNAVFVALQRIERHEQAGATGALTIVENVPQRTLPVGAYRAAKYALIEHVTRDQAAARFAVPVDDVIEAWKRLGFPTRVRT